MDDAIAVNSVADSRRAQQMPLLTDGQASINGQNAHRAPLQETTPTVLSTSDNSHENGRLPHVDESRPVLGEKRRPVVQCLPQEIIQQILYFTDPNGFASLVLLSPEWRRASKDLKLYLHQLSRCPSYTTRNSSLDGPFVDDDLPKLQHLFNLEVKRNLFDVFSRPQQTIIKLVSTSVSSSSAFPGGEAFHFAFSPNGHIVLALSSSRIYVVDTATPDISITRELKILRRPVSAAILDDGSILAVLSTDHQVNVYDLSEAAARPIRSVSLDNPPRTIALSPGGSVLAAAYDGGIEVYSLASNALSTDRRAVKCDAVDSLSFSDDGVLLLGTTLHSPHPNTVILSAPYYHEGGEDVPASELLSQMWTTQILFPNNSRDCSHATLLPRAADGETNWAFTHDRVFETFRAVRVEDLRNGTTYFTGPRSSDLNDGYNLPSTIPASSSKGEIVAAGFAGNEIWLYGVPENLDFIPDTSSANGQVSGSGQSTPAPGRSQPNVMFPAAAFGGRDSGTGRIPQWQVLCDKFRNVFTKGRSVDSVDGMSALRWVDPKGRPGGCSHLQERLIAVAPGVHDDGHSIEDDGDLVPTDGGRIVVFDFDASITNGGKREITIELGDVIPEVLEEESRDLETEVAIVRRRTVAQKRGGLGGPHRADMNNTPTEAGDSPARNYLRAPGVPPLPPSHSIVDRPMTSSHRQVPAVTVSQDPSYAEVQEALDGPYSHTDPRSRTSLHRAATAAAGTRRYANASAIPAHGRVQFHRSRRDPPHESDADNWVPPPPPYNPEPENPLPDHLQQSLMPRSTMPTQRVTAAPLPPVRSHTMLDEITQSALQRTRTTIERATNNLRERRLSVRRHASDESHNVLPSDPPPVPPLPRPQANLLSSPPRTGDFFQGSMRRPAHHEDEDLYEITPPISPVDGHRVGGISVIDVADLTPPGQSDVHDTPISQGDSLRYPPPTVPEVTPVGEDLTSSPRISEESYRGAQEVASAPAQTLALATAPVPLQDRQNEEEESTTPISIASARRSMSNVVSTEVEEMEESRISHESHSSPDGQALPGRSATPSSSPSPIDPAPAPEPKTLFMASAPKHIPHDPLSTTSLVQTIPRRPVRSSPASVRTQHLNTQMNQSSLQPHRSSRDLPSEGPNQGAQSPAESTAPSASRPASTLYTLHAGLSEAGKTHGPVAPSPEQLAALQNRYSGSQSSRPRPASARPGHSGAVFDPTRGWDQLTSTPPRAAQGVYQSRSEVVGAFGTDAPSTSNQGVLPGDSGRGVPTPPGGSLERRGNRSPRNRSPGTRSPSRSAHNLLMRPDLSRMDTIHSVRSQASGFEPPQERRPSTAFVSATDYSALETARRRGQGALPTRELPGAQQKRGIWERFKRGGSDESMQKEAVKEESWEDVKRAWRKEEKRSKTRCVVM